MPQITTVDIKHHLRDVLTLGGGKTNILVLGSCRCVPYINYLHDYNMSSGEPFKIFCIEPNNYHWNEQEMAVNVEEALTKAESNERVLKAIEGTEIFIHEHYGNFQMFNTSREAEKNIYQFGMNPKIDIAIPNWHNHFILEGDWKDCGVETPDNYAKRGEAEIEKFCSVCSLSSFPKFSDLFRSTWRNVRYFWRPNHVSAAFTKLIFAQMNGMFLHLSIDKISDHDMYETPHTEVTQRDREAYQITW